MAGGLRFIRKLGFLSGKSCLVALTPWIGLLGRGYCLLGLFAACFVGKQRKILIIYFGTAMMRGQYGVLSFKSLVLVLLALGVPMIEEFLLHPPFKDKGDFLWLAEVCYYLGHLW